MFEQNKGKDIYSPDFDMDEVRTRNNWKNKKNICQKIQEEVDSREYIPRCPSVCTVEYGREYAKKYQKERRARDPLYKLLTNTRNLIKNSVIKYGYTKKSRTYEILGIPIDEFKIFLESKFIDGMSWNNYGEWHLDHIIPISWAKNEEEIFKLNHCTNFQPLWRIDNLKKGNRI